MKATRSDAEFKWRKWYSDERWERRVDHMMVKFSAVTTMLPRQMKIKHGADATDKPGKG